MSEVFVNKDDNLVQTGKLPSAIVFEGKDPEEKMYLVLYIGKDEDGKDIKSYEDLQGRTATYNFIKGMIDYIDIYESRVLVETVTLGDALNVYEFMKQVSKYINDPSFDIEDYNYGDSSIENENSNYSDPNNYI